MRCLRVLALFGICAFAHAQNATPELWYWQHSYMNGDSAVQQAETQIDQAKSWGYTGVVFWDSSFAFASAPFFDSGNLTRLQTVMTYALSRGMQATATIAPYGDSRNDLLMSNPNWAEASRVVGSQFQVNSAGTGLTMLNSFPASGIQNAGFESGKTVWFGYNDDGTGVDYSTAHSGIASGVVTNAPMNARFLQTVTLKPWRQYHLRFWYKSQNFSGSPAFYINDAADYSKQLLNVPYWNASGTQGWTQMDYIFNSQDITNAALLFGVWGGSSGSLWFDDVSIEETALIYAVRRPATPVRVYDPNSGTTYNEGSDYNHIQDNQVEASRTPYTDDYHLPTPVTLPAGTRLKPGQIVDIDSYSVFPVPGALTVGACLTDAGVLAYQTANAQALKPIIPNGAGLMMQYDEMRQMDSDTSCKAKNMTPGQLLAWSVQNTIDSYSSQIPGASLFVWSDMFDPYHNAIPHYYYAEGDMSGSWTGLPSNVTVMNWNLGNLTNSLTWFSGMNPSQPVPHQQFIAGYYDNGNGAQDAQQEIAAAAGIPGVRGLMYTTWNNDYSQMQAYAQEAQKDWPAYLNSIGKPQPVAPPAPVAPTPSAPTAFSGTFEIVASNSGKCLDVDGQSTANGARVQQWDCWGGANQTWKLTPQSDGTYQILSVNSEKALDVTGGTSAVNDGDSLEQWDWWDGANQKFRIVPSGSGYNITSSLSGKCLDISGGPDATQDGAVLEQWSCWGGSNQQFLLVSH